MEYKKLGDAYLLRLDPGDEIIKCITDVCKEENLSLGTIQGIGACNQVTLGFFNPKTKEYKEQIFHGDYEICPLIGNVTTMEGKIYLHCHINLSGDDFKSFGGHLKQARISATCEIFILPLKGKVDRKKDETIGLNLIQFG